MEQTLLGEGKTVSAAPEVVVEADHPRIRIPIRAKITLPYLLLSLALALGAAYVVTRIVFDTVEERFTNQLIESGKLASEWMVREESLRLETLRLLAHAEGVPAAIQAGDAERLRELAFGITVDNQEEAVEFLDYEGNLVMSMRHRKEGNVEDYAFGKGGEGDFLAWEFVRRVYSGQADQSGDKFSGFVQAEWGDYFYVSGPIFDDAGDLAGVVLVGKTLDTITTQLRQETLSQVTLYAFDGQPIESTFFEAVPLDTAFAAEILERQDQGSYQRGLEHLRDLNVANLDYQEILAPWEARGDVDLGLMGISLAKSFWVKPSQMTKIQIILLVASTLLIVILLGINLANFITTPLLGLVSASKEVSEGNLQVRVEPKSNDEIAVLGQTFNQMVANLYQSKMDLVQAYDSTLEGWSKALELRDEGTEGHTQRVTEMTLRLARFMNFEDAELADVRRGALLHDIGKMGVPDAILLKPGPLTEEEWTAMRRHPGYAYEMLSPIEYLCPALDIPYCHHERWDGGGYPRGLKGEQIPLAARIFAVVDVWDALRSERPYRKALPEDEVLEHIWAGSGSHFDPRVVEAFVRMIRMPQKT